MKQYYVYILANKKDGAIYVGVTSDLIKRIYEHKNSINAAYTSKYKIHNLVYFEIFNEIENAILREKQLKAGNRKTKIELIEINNSDWNDLYDDLIK